MSENGSRYANNRAKCYLGCRHIQILMLYIGLSLAYGMRVSMSIAIVAMTLEEEANVDQFKPYSWNFQTQAVVLSSFMTGYVVTMLPATTLVARFGSKLLISAGILINAVMSALIPSGAYYGDWQYVCGCRIIQGVGQGTMMSAVDNMIQNWIPAVDERNKVEAVISTAMPMGVAVQLVISGFIISKWNWPMIFYINSISALVWTIVFVAVCSNTPISSKFVSEKEKKYIIQCNEERKNKETKAPWYRWWYSLPFISLVVANCAQNWGMWTLMTMVPLYLGNVTGLGVVENGVISALPFVAMVLVSFPLRFISHVIIKRHCLRTSIVRKIYNTIGFFGTGMCLLGLSYQANDVTETAVLLISALALNAGHYSGFVKSHSDLSPDHGDTLRGVSNGFAEVLSIFAPLVAGAIIKEQTDPKEWRPVFNLSATLYIACNVFYLIFSTSEKQAWDDIGTQKKADSSNVETK